MSKVRIGFLISGGAPASRAGEGAFAIANSFCGEQPCVGEAKPPREPRALPRLNFHASL
jgi:hypothetical protein